MTTVQRLWHTAGTKANAFMSVGLDFARDLSRLKAPEGLEGNVIIDWQEVQSPRQTNFWGMGSSSETSR